MSKQFIMSGIDPVINLVGFQALIGRWARQWMRFSNWVWGDASGRSYCHESGLATKQVTNYLVNIFLIL